MTIEEALNILTGYIGGKIDPESTELYHAIELAVDILESQPSLPSNIEEAADCYKETIEPEDVDDYVNGVFYETFTEYQIADAFKAGAKWMAGQGVKIAETKIYLEDDGDEPPYSQEWLDLESTEFKLPDKAFQPGDEVEVILRKKQ